MSEDFGEWFRKALDTSGMSMRDLERASGVSYDVITKLKSGKNKSTTADNARRLESALSSYVQPQQGFAEPSSQQPRIDVLRRLAASEQGPDGPSPLREEIKIAVVGTAVQVSATVEADRIDELIRRLRLAQEMVTG